MTDGKTDVEIDLELEDWGRVALLAHRLDLTINATIEYILTKFIEEEKRKEEMNKLLWRPMHEALADRDDCLRRVIMAGYMKEDGKNTAHVGEAFYGCPDARSSRWIWRSGGDVIDPLGFQDLPDFPIDKHNDKYVTGGATRFPEEPRE